MPFYDFLCKGCGAVFEVRATIKEKEAGLKLACPECGGHEVRQRLSRVQMISGGTDFPPPGCGPNAGPGCCG
jgi:putative FmdB family regulatory protein